MRKFLFLAVSLAILGFTSCSNESDFQEEVSKEKVEKFSFVYKGVSYSSYYTIMLEDAIIVLQNAEVNELYKELSQLPQLTTLVREDGTIELFDTPSEALRTKYQ